MSKSLSYVAELTQVLEVSLQGTADLAFWKGRLSREDLVPVELDGRAQIRIIAAEMTFRGVRFSEVSFSVVVDGQELRPSGDSYFLVRAFNSCRLFAFCERALFSTPYDHGDCQVATTSPVSIRLAKGGEVLFRAEMSAASLETPREPSLSGHESWEGPVFLPAIRRDQGRLFFAKIQGETRTYPFLNGVDSMAIGPSQCSEVVRALVESRFVGKEWIIRQDAEHSRSKTFTRPGAVARPTLK